MASARAKSFFFYLFVTVLRLAEAVILLEYYAIIRTECYCCICVISKENYSSTCFSQIIDFFPYPIAILTPQHTLVMVNKAFAPATKMRLMNPEKEPARILQYKITGTRLAAVLTRVFTGDAFFLEDIEDPFSKD